MCPYPLEGTTQGGTSENRLVPGESHLFLCSFPHCPQPLLSIQKGILSQLLINSCGNDRGLFRLASLSGHREPRQKSKVFFVLYLVRQALTPWHLYVPSDMPLVTGGTELRQVCEQQ